MRKKYVGIIIISLLTIMIKSGSIEAQTNELNPNFAPESSKILKKMDAYLSGFSEFSLHVDIKDEQALAGGQKQAGGWRLDVIVRQPDRLQGKVIFNEPEHEKEFYYNGKTITFVDKIDNSHSQIETAGTTKKVMDIAMDHLGLNFPLSDFVFTDLYENMTQKVLTSDYLGHADGGGRDCHLLAFHQESIDWYIWVDAGKKPVPRKFMIIHKDKPDRTKYVAEFLGHKPLDRIGNATFEYIPQQEIIETAASTVEESVEQEVELAAEAPIEESVESPVAVPVEAAVEESVETPKEVPVEAPVEEFVEPPAEVPAAAAVEESVEQATEVAAEAPAEELVEPPAEVAVEALIEESVEPPAEGSAELPAEEPAAAASQ